MRIKITNLVTYDTDNRQFILDESIRHKKIRRITSEEYFIKKNKHQQKCIDAGCLVSKNRLLCVETNLGFINWMRYFTIVEGPDLNKLNIYFNNCWGNNKAYANEFIIKLMRKEDLRKCIIKWNNL